MLLPKNENRYNELAAKWLSGTITPNEREEFSQWYNTDQHKPFIIPQEFAVSEEDHKQRIFNKIKSEIRENRVAKPIKLFWPSVAAAIILIMGVGLFFYFKKSSFYDTQNLAISKSNDIKPGGNKAILTLANGKKIVLTDAAIGELAKQAGIQITKTGDGQLVYTVSKDKSDLHPAEPSSFNLIETPKGGQYQVGLPDGTKVWLNAASSLKYPTQFTANERRVELTGEGYFEVAKMIKGSKRIPFIVKTASQIVEVLGTHFNINTYADEATTKTTLLEGSVRVSQFHGDQLRTTISKLLSPGQQAILGAMRFDIENVDVEEAVAWKNGYFLFQDENLKTVMNKLSRWYDIEVFYQGNLDKIKIGGFVSRSKNLSEVLRVLQLTGKVKFKTEERRVTVML